MNPALTLAVYIERNKFRTYWVFASLIIIVQIIGSFGGIFAGWMLRVTLPTDAGESDYDYYYVPG